MSAQLTAGQHGGHLAGLGARGVLVVTAHTEAWHKCHLGAEAQLLREVKGLIRVGLCWGRERAHMLRDD